MRLTALFALLFCLIAPPALAGQLYTVELLVFQQSNQALPASQSMPSDWALQANSLNLGSERSTELNNEAARLTPANGYQLLFHKAWQQPIGNTAESIAISSDDQRVNALLTLQSQRFIDLNAQIWVNQMGPDQNILSSEKLTQNARLKNAELTYLDHGSIGALIRISQP